jgi:hypothetical protein
MMRALLLWCSSALALADSLPLQLSVDASEAEQALRIIRKGAGVTPADWDSLYATVPYQQLKAREASMGRSFSDADFQKFLLSPKALAKQPVWEKALAEMKQADIGAIGARVLAWLPAGAAIRATVFPEIKPWENSFVWTKPGGDPAIFLYVGGQTRDQFENTVAHECHHIGLQSLSKEQESILAELPENVKQAVRWMGGFGEGEAMLAAAGSADRHPHWEDDALKRVRWDGDLMHFNSDVAALQQFFTEILDGKFKDQNEIMKRAQPFWGDAQGAWYTVGYEMAVLVETKFGRRALLECLIDPRKLLVFYNRIAQEGKATGADLAAWSSEFSARLGR